LDCSIVDRRRERKVGRECWGYEVHPQETAGFEFFDHMGA
jgi:hypothetical protein